MITKLTIANFKSVRILGLDLTRVNVLIGAPGAGKSNIVESLGLMLASILLVRLTRAAFSREEILTKWK